MPEDWTMPNNAPAEIKPRLIELVDAAHVTKRAFIDNLTPAQRAEEGVGDHWSARDVLAHVIFWEGRQAERVVAALTGSAPPAAEEDDVINERVLVAGRAWSWPEVEAEIARVAVALRDAITASSEAVLTDPQQPPWLNRRPLWLGITGNLWEHSTLHYADYYRGQGDRARGDALQQAAVDRIGQLFPDTPAYANAMYNLGCYYALNGQAEQAIAAVGEALRRAPDLVEWSLQDADLASLRDLPAFQALYQA
jgi:tetratricopeptide (TPR) repeat protein